MVEHFLIATCIHWGKLELWCHDYIYYHRTVIPYLLMCLFSTKFPNILLMRLHCIKVLVRLVSCGLAPGDTLHHTSIILKS